MRKNRKVRFKLGVILKLTEFFIEEAVICFEVAKLFNAGTTWKGFSGKGLPQSSNHLLSNFQLDRVLRHD